MRLVTAFAVAGVLAAACVTQPDETPVDAPVEVQPEVDEDGGASDDDLATIASSNVEPEAEPMRVTGSLTYRQRVPLPSDARVSLSLWEQGAEISEGAFREESLSLNGRQVPVPFGVEIENWEEISTGLVRLEARILNAAGELLWTNNDGTVFSKDAGPVNLGSVVLSPEPRAVVSIPQLAGNEWMVARLGDDPLLQTTRATIRFGEDGRISGNASCNAYTGSFKLNAGMLTIAPLALTRKACVPQLMEQEQAIISVLQTVSYVQIDESGLLVLENEDGARITARQGAS